MILNTFSHKTRKKSIQTECFPNTPLFPQIYTVFQLIYTFHWKIGNNSLNLQLHFSQKIKFKEKIYGYLMKSCKFSDFFIDFMELFAYNKSTGVTAGAKRF